MWVWYPCKMSASQTQAACNWCLLLTVDSIERYTRKQQWLLISAYAVLYANVHALAGKSAVIPWRTKRWQDDDLYQSCRCMSIGKKTHHYVEPNTSAKILFVCHHVVYAKGLLQNEPLFTILRESNLWKLQHKCKTRIPWLLEEILDYYEKSSKAHR